MADPLIDEIRQIREEIGRECDNNLKKLFDELRKLQDEQPERVIYRRNRDTDQKWGL